jgi:hypothetical protein
VIEADRQPGILARARIESTSAADPAQSRAILERHLAVLS